MELHSHILFQTSILFIIVAKLCLMTDDPYFAGLMVLVSIIYGLSAFYRA